MTRSDIVNSKAQLAFSSSSFNFILSSFFFLFFSGFCLFFYIAANILLFIETSRTLHIARGLSYPALLRDGVTGVAEIAAP